MKNKVIIKGNRYGITIVFDKNAEWKELLTELANKLENAGDFFDSDRQLAVNFEGRTLTNEELDQVLSVIQNCSKLNIQYVVEHNNDLETTFFDIIQTVQERDKLAMSNDSSQSEFNSKMHSHSEFDDLFEGFEEYNEQEYLPDNIPTDFKPTSNLTTDSSGLFYRGTLRSGQTLEAKDSLIIIGDVNPGASVIAGGNIVIIGALKGSVIAGATGNSNAFVMALSMNPIQIQIADVVARSSDGKKISKHIRKDAMIATVVNDQIVMDLVSKTTFEDIHF